MAAVKMNAPVETVPSAVLLLEIFSCSGADGDVASLTLKVSVPPPSVVIRPLVRLTTTPGTSLSTFVQLITGIVNPLNGTVWVLVNDTVTV